jgi:uncharacterized phage protein (TIGR01671 family)
MRDIRFRAWDKRNKMMFSWEEVIKIKQTVGEGIEVEMPLRELESNQLNWMQFTGLKDKNGTPIYEGDIVQVYKHMSGEKSGVYKVVWNEEKCNYDGIFPNIAVWCLHEVVGNIYESPELLERKV